MENSCLVTKLKYAVDNSNLPYFDSLEINVFKQQEGTEYYPVDHSFITLLGDNYKSKFNIVFIDGGYLCSSTGIADPDGDYFSDGDYKMVIIGKSKMTRFVLTGNMYSASSVSSANIDTLKYSDKLTNVTLQSYNPIYGNIENLSKNILLTFFSVVNPDNTSLTGEVTVLLQKLIENGINHSVTMAYNWNATGGSTFITLNIPHTERRFTFNPISSTSFTITSEAAYVDTWTKVDGVWTVS